MDLFLAAVLTSNFGKAGTIYQKLTEVEKKARDNHPHILESYHYVHKESFVEKMRQEGLRVFLDSGAFSAHTKGVEIDLPGYCDYIKRNHDIIRYDADTKSYLFSVLDGIGDPVKTGKNQEAMERLGTRPLPCFHYGEPESYLEWYIRKYDYITLGGMVPIATKQLYYWLDRIWDRYLTDGSGRPRVKVHGFGLTTIDLMTRFPWASVDSSSWVQIAVHGNIIIPENDLMKAGIPDDPYDCKEKDRIVAISSDSPRTKQEDYHYDTIAEPHREVIRRFIEQQGFTVDRLKASAYSRWAWNFFAFNEINKRVNKQNTQRFKAPQPALFQ